VRVLVDYSPRDDRSGSATEAVVPEFIDFLMADQTPAPTRMAPTPAQISLRGGLAWLDQECARRFNGNTFLKSSDAQRRQVLDDIAWPAKAKPEFSHGVAFFNRMGLADIKCMGNVFVGTWDGCSADVVQKLVGA
jgi:gluconate 2-dehydrogenase gamma chain